ncbi:MAG: hypothetical protein OXE81_09150 [Gammaproteobacteria bacterium]|nr:hypothetical protein [Gammaproteobacteria bacterium]MCY4277983.1 hypothetical protein [Gammaproteobacteria bacterium]
MASDPYAWRLPQRVIELKHFDYPALRQRSEFDGDKIAAIASPRMAGCPIQRSPEQIRDAIVTGAIDDEARTYLHDLIMQFDCYEMRRFAMYCGASSYEIARAMIECDISLRLLSEWMNCQSPDYESTDTHHRTWDLGLRL